MKKEVYFVTGFLAIGMLLIYLLLIPDKSVNISIDTDKDGVTDENDLEKRRHDIGRKHVEHKNPRVDRQSGGSTSVPFWEESGRSALALRFIGSQTAFALVLPPLVDPRF